MFHKNCGNVLVDVSSSFILLADVNASSSNREFQTVRIQLHQKETKIDNVKFYCTNCNHNVEIDDIVIRCRRCGEDFPIKDIIIPNDTGGFFCGSCIKMFSDERHTRLETIMTKPLIIR